jgi:hypothetical protein
MSATVIKWKTMKPIPQEDSAKCWLAAYQMMFQWKGKPLDTIRSLVETALGEDGATKAYDEGLERDDWPKICKAFGMTGVAGKDTTLDDITGLLSHGPLLVHGKFPLGMHSIVVFGTDDDYDQVGYINPYWQGSKEVKERWSAFSWLHDGILGNNTKAATMQYWG